MRADGGGTGTPATDRAGSTLGPRLAPGSGLRHSAGLARLASTGMMEPAMTTTGTRPPASAPASRPAAAPRRVRPLLAGRTLSGRAARIMVWQAATLGALWAVGPGRSAAVATGCAGMLALTALRWRNRWLDERVRDGAGFLGRAYRSRRGRPHSVVAGRVASTITDRMGNRVGLASDRTSWTAALRVAPTDRSGVDPRPVTAALLNVLAAAFHAQDMRPAAVQMLAWSPTGTAASGAATPPARRWVTVRIDPAMCPVAVRARGGGSLGAARVTAMVLVRLAAALHEAGFDVDLIDGERVPAEVAASLGLDRGHGPAMDGTEGWRSCSTGRVHQVCYRARRLPKRTSGGLIGLIARTAGAPAAFTCWSVTLSRSAAAALTARVTLRVGIPERPTPAVLRRVEARLGRELVRCDGSHHHAVRATVPLGHDRG